MENGRPDTLDLQIIRLLRLDGRCPTKTIANTLDVTEATVTARIRALSEGGVMRVMAQRNVRKLRERLPCFINVSVRGRSLDEVAADLARLNRITTVNVCVGGPEIHVMGFVEENTQAVARLENEIGQVKGVDRLEVNLALETRVFRSDYAALDAGPMPADPDGDPLDERIIRQLQIDGRVSNREIARLLNVPASTVRERVNRMLNANMIRIGAVCEPTKLGLSLAGLGYLQIAAARIEEALRYLQSIEDLGIVTRISGPHNVLVLFGARDFAHLVSIVKTRLEITPGLAEISIRLIAETKKHRADLITIVEPDSDSAHRSSRD
ncbi:MAG TPA: Lrp/AsnC family transcriptional regulator [Steroidobacteraceae bacterium]